MLDAQLGIPSETVALVVNAHEKRRHNKRSEIEWALGRPAAAVIPYDRSAAERALAAQRPLVLERKSAAARALLELAGRVHGGEIVLPPEEAAGSRWDRIRRRFRRGADSREAEGRPAVQLNEEAADGGNTVHAR
jgi:MinD-like ATPase involved in chromosome partitioning or flagellar assembly